MKLTTALNVRRVLFVVTSLFVAMATARAHTRPDAEITTEARSALQSASGNRMAAVHVETSYGRVTLFGKVQSQRDKASAAADVGRVAGVLQVRNLVQVIATRDNARVRRTDAAVKADVQRTLSADRSLDDSGITVTSVSNGVVLLGGGASSSNDVVRAFASTGNRPGVRRVFSEIDAQSAIVLPPAVRYVGAPVETTSAIRVGPVETEDDVIRRSVMTALSDLDASENAEIKVMVKDGVVWLSGSVPTWQGNATRLHAVRSVTGVRSIYNGVRVVAMAAMAR